AHALRRFLCHSLHYVLSFFLPWSLFLFSFTDPLTTAIYTLSLHDALPIFARTPRSRAKIDPTLSHDGQRQRVEVVQPEQPRQQQIGKHTSELQSRGHLVCRLLLEKKKHTRPKKNEQAHIYTPIT